MSLSAFFEMLKNDNADASKDHMTYERLDVRFDFDQGDSIFWELRPDGNHLLTHYPSIEDVKFKKGLQIKECTFEGMDLVFINQF